MSPCPPESRSELLQRARRLAGLSVGHLAARLDCVIPPNLKRHKGWLGKLVEQALGAEASNSAGPDFPGLGVELKTIPVDRHGNPRETTFVCSVPLADPDEVSWQTSVTRDKLSCVLWIPILDDNSPLPGRIFGSPLLWSPTAAEQRQLAEDWRSHLDVIRRGYVDSITAADGDVLQIRPKGATADSLTWSVDPDGGAIMTQPRGFYLRTSFTGSILRRHFAIG